MGRLCGSFLCLICLPGCPKLPTRGGASNAAFSAVFINASTARFLGRGGDILMICVCMCV